MVQSMPEVSPTKWHLAHTSWFFETFLLKPYKKGYREFDSDFSYLFNSYYNAIGDRHCRQNRGLLSRPTVREIRDYRRHVDEHMRILAMSSDIAHSGRIASLLEIGINHEQQHQELMLTDIKHVFWVNPLRPAYLERVTPEETKGIASKWISVIGGLREIGHDGVGFAFDNEGPLHQEYVAPFEIASRLVTNGEFKQFILAGGYQKPEYWLSLGWATVQAEQWRAPLYWLESAWRMAKPHPQRPAADCRRGAGMPCQLFRSRRFCTMGRREITHRVRVGNRLGLSGSPPRRLLSNLAPFIRESRKIGQGCSRCSEKSGNGRAAPIRLIPATLRQRERWANTTASSCVINTFCVGVP